MITPPATHNTSQVDTCNGQVNLKFEEELGELKSDFDFDITIGGKTFVWSWSREVERIGWRLGDWMRTTNCLFQLAYTRRLGIQYRQPTFWGRF